MPQPANLKKAKLREIKWVGKNNKVVSQDKVVEVQFNPQTLKVTYSNQISGGGQIGGSAIQYVGKGTTKLSMELWFDVTISGKKDKVSEVDDVRKLTEEINYFIKTKGKAKKKKNKYIPPGVRFIWGSFLFEGIMDSMDENLEFFSADGKPQRARVSIGLTSQEIQFQPPSSNSQQPPAGTQTQKTAKSGDTIQGISASEGKPNSWKEIAAANNIENPRLIKPGTLIRVDIGID